MKIMKKMLLGGVLAAIMCVFGTIKIILPFTPVPITPELIICLISGALLGASGGACVMLVYFISEMFFFPVFFDIEPGVSYIFSPAAGYMLGFIPCAYLSGKLVSFFYKAHGRFFIRFASIFTSFAISTIILYCFEALFFSVLTSSGVIKALALSVMPFVWLDLLKIVFSAFIVLKAFEITYEIKRERGKVHSL